MRKILISTLGTGDTTEDEQGNKIADYKEANYKFPESDKIYSTKFIAEALIKEIQPDKVIVLGSNGSAWNNLYTAMLSEEELGSDEQFDIYLEFTKKIDDEVIENDSDEHMILFNNKMKEYIEKETDSVNPRVKSYILQYGRNDEEIKTNVDIFMDILKYLEDGDEIYFDITHMFRSIPMFAFIMLQFIETLNSKDIEMKGLYYGMFEAKEINAEGMKITPVVDLKYLLDLSKWINATQDFVDHGNGSKLAKLLNQDGTNPELQERLERVSTMLNFNFLHEFKMEIPHLRGSMRKAEDDKGLFKYVEPSIVEMLDRFEFENIPKRDENLEIIGSRPRELDQESKSQMELSKWYFEHDNYGFGYICLEEAIITRLCELYGADSSEINDYDYRNKLKKTIFNKDNYKERFNDGINELFKLHQSINAFRMQVAHSSIQAD